MNRRYRWLGVTLALLCAHATAGSAQSAGWRWQGNVEGFGKYNSNLTLLSADGPLDAKDAFLTGLSGRLSGSRSLGAWRLDTQLAGITNLHTEHAEEDWHFARGRAGLRHPLAGGTVELSNEARYYTVPDRDTFDFLRNFALLSWRRPLSERWQLRGGYESILTRYTQSRDFDYTVHGVLLELRTRWSLGFTTHYLVDLQRYHGEATPQDVEAEASPQDGNRAMARAGFDWLFAGRHSLSGTYSLQADEADLGVQQIGDFEGPGGSQDIEAEFDLVKHKATLLYSFAFSRRLLLSSYAEWIRKRFDAEERHKRQLPKRADSLLLTATHLRLRLDERLSLKLRYLYRGNRSSVDLLDYGNHIFAVGLELRSP